MADNGKVLCRGEITNMYHHRELAVHVIVNVYGDSFGNAFVNVSEDVSGDAFAKVADKRTT